MRRISKNKVLRKAKRWNKSTSFVLHCHYPLFESTCFDFSSSPPFLRCSLDEIKCIRIVLQYNMCVSVTVIASVVAFSA